ncbi:hypothetical protein HPB47_025847, partial [Ixodes persulcatus]
KVPFLKTHQLFRKYNTAVPSSFSVEHRDSPASPEIYSQGGACQIDPSDGCSNTAAVACVEHLVPFVGEPRVPETPEELEAHCELEKVDLTCGNKYVERCLQGFFRGVSYAALNALRRESAGKCNASHSDHKRYLAGARCLNRAGGSIHECYQTFKEELYRIIVGATPERRLEHGCCETSRLFHCKQRSIEQACGDSDTEPTSARFLRALARRTGHTLLPALRARLARLRRPRRASKTRPERDRAPELSAPDEVL